MTGESVNGWHKLITYVLAYLSASLPTQYQIVTFATNVTNVIIVTSVTLVAKVNIVTRVTIVTNVTNVTNGINVTKSAGASRWCFGPWQGSNPCS